MKKRIKKQNTLTVVTVIIVLLIIAGAIIAIINFTGNIEKGFKAFSLTVDGVEVTKNSSGYALTCDTPLNVDVNYAFPKFSKEHNDYTVKVVPSKVADFNFTLEGDPMKFSDEADLTLGFDIVPTEKGFTLAPKGSVRRILLELYPSSDIEIKDNAYDVNTEYYTLVVTSYNGKCEIRLNFAVLEDWSVSGLDIDKTEIIF